MHSFIHLFVSFFFCFIFYFLDSSFIHSQFLTNIFILTIEYVETAFIPAGARNIRIEEVKSAENYLALKSSSGFYYLNGHWNIQDTGKYDAAGTKVFYARRNQKDQLRAIGPTKEDLHVQVSQLGHVGSMSISSFDRIPCSNLEVVLESSFYIRSHMFMIEFPLYFKSIFSI